MRNPTSRGGPLHRGHWARGINDALREGHAKRAALGVIMRPGESLRRYVGRGGAGGTASTGVRILLGEGAYPISAAGLTIARPRVHFVSLSPGRTRFVRTSTATGPMFTISGAQVLFDGIRFVDAAGSQPALLFTGTAPTVRRCYFEDCYRAVQANGARWFDFSDSHIEASRDTSYAIYLTGTTSDGRVSGWRVESSPTTVIRGDDSVARTVFTSNTIGGSGVISYKSGNGCVDGGTNTGTVTAR